MKILLNGRDEEFDRVKMSVDEMLVIRKYSFKMRIIKINDVLITRDKYASTYIHDGDKVDMLYLMSGG